MRKYFTPTAGLLYETTKNSFVPVTGLWIRGTLKDLKDSKLTLNESKLFPWSSRISLVPFRIFRGSLFPKPVTGQELFFGGSYSKLALNSSVKEAVLSQFLMTNGEFLFRNFAETQQPSGSLISHMFGLLCENMKISQKTFG